MSRAKKGLYLIIFLFCAAIIITIGISFFVFRSFCSRFSISDAQRARSASRRKELIEEWGGREISLSSGDGIRIAALLIERKSAKRVIMFCHGFRGYKEQMCRYMVLFPHDTLICFDFRAHGQSSGSLITFGYYEKYDVQAVIDFVRSYAPTKDLPLIGLGVSMGGAALILSQKKSYHIDALIVDSAFSNLADQIEHVFTRKTGLPLFPFLSITYALFSYGGSCKLSAINPALHGGMIISPVLIIHSLDDSFTPVAQANRLYNAIRARKYRWWAPGAAHACVIKQYPQLYASVVESFLAAVQRAPYG